MEQASAVMPAVLLPLQASLDVQERSALHSLARWFSLVRGRGTTPTWSLFPWHPVPPPIDPGHPLSEAQGMAASRVFDQPKLARLTRAHGSAVTRCAPVSDMY